MEPTALGRNSRKSGFRDDDHWEHAVAHGWPRPVKPPKKPPMRIYKEFFFEAAHYLPSAPPGHPNARIHGHSFRVRVELEGKADPETGVVVHFEDFDAAMADARDALDHRCLNDVEGLDLPTLERITEWLWDRLDNRLPGLAEITVARDSCREGCVYRGPNGR